MPSSRGRYKRGGQYLVAHTPEGRAIHVPGISGLKLTESLLANLRTGHANGKCELSTPAGGADGEVVVKLPKM